jgi:hypothetical protein
MPHFPAAALTGKAQRATAHARLWSATGNEPAQARQTLSIHSASTRKIQSWHWPGSEKPSCPGAGRGLVFNDRAESAVSEGPRTRLLCTQKAASDTALAVIPGHPRSLVATAAEGACRRCAQAHPLLRFIEAVRSPLLSRSCRVSLRLMCWRLSLRHPPA